MVIHHQIDGQLNIPAVPRSVALGLFDGLHAGHRQVIVAAVEGGDDDLTRSVLTFLPHTVIKAGFDRLCTDRDEQNLLATMGVEELIKADFTVWQHLSPEEFVRDVLHETLNAKRVSCGYNYRFGAGGAGDAALLTELCAAYGITVTVVPEVNCGDTPINSTAIRAAITAGDMASARRLLGRPYCLKLPVIHGQHLGRRLGLPTVNQLLPTDTVLPRFGVYASCIQWDGNTYPAVTNIGVRPTVGTDAPLAETYILGFDGNLYGTEPTVYPIRYLREEHAFDSLEDLQTQIQKDAAAAQALFTPPEHREIRAVFFDFDDTLDNRDTAFRNGLSSFIHYYYPSLTEEEAVARRDELFSHQRGGYGKIIYYSDLVEHFLPLYPPERKTDTQHALRRLEISFSRESIPHPDVIPTLVALRERGYLLGIVTNGQHHIQARKIDHSGLRPYVDLVVLAGEEVCQKPDPRIFRLAAARLGVPCECCLFVGDHPETDIAGARAAGFIPVRKRFELDAEHPLHRLQIPADVPVINRIGDILDILPIKEDN